MLSKNISIISYIILYLWWRKLYPLILHNMIHNGFSIYIPEYLSEILEKNMCVNIQKQLKTQALLVLICKTNIVYPVYYLPNWFCSMEGRTYSVFFSSQMGSAYGIWQYWKSSRSSLVINETTRECVHIYLNNVILVWCKVCAWYIDYSS